MLEVGGGLGVLSEFLAPQVAHLHVVEVDRSLEPPLRGGARAVRQRDAPPRRRGEARLRRAGAAARTRSWRTSRTAWRQPCCSSRSPSCPEARLWVAMVQREVGERLAAAPGRKSYGATSVLAQLACDVRVLRKVPRTVFHPEPNVDSALVVLRRRGPAPAEELRGARPRRLRPPPQGAGRLARAHARGAPTTSATPRAPPSSSSATRPTPAPSGCRRSDWPRLADAIGRERLAALRPRA